jgi:sugar/nucleoside kinase (ribokinase family)
MAKARRQAFSSLEKLACDVSANFKIVKASDEDTASIFGWYEPDNAAKRLLECGPDVIVITMGKHGALVYTKGGHWQVPPVQGNAIDTTGGGDTFMAGFLSEYLRSGDPVRSAQWGCATAICVIEGSGGVRVERMPTRNQVQARFDTSYP